MLGKMEVNGRKMLTQRILASLWHHELGLILLAVWLAKEPTPRDRLEYILAEHNIVMSFDVMELQFSSTGKATTPAENLQPNSNDSSGPAQLHENVTDTKTSYSITSRELKT